MAIVAAMLLHPGAVMVRLTTRCWKFIFGRDT
jgi:hypothetical protein